MVEWDNRLPAAVAVDRGSDDNMRPRPLDAMPGPLQAQPLQDPCFLEEAIVEGSSVRPRELGEGCS